MSFAAEGGPRARRRGLQRQRRLPRPHRGACARASRRSATSATPRAAARRSCAPRSRAACRRAWPTTGCTRPSSCAWGARPAPPSAPPRSTWRASRWRRWPTATAPGAFRAQARLAGHAHELLALGSRAPGLARLAAAPRREDRRGTPAGAGSPLAKARGQLAVARSADGRGPRIALMADTFTRYLEPAVGEAAVRVLGGRPARASRWWIPAAAGGRSCRRAWWTPRGAGPGGRSTGWRRTPWRARRSWCSSHRAGRCWWTTSPASCPAIRARSGWRARPSASSGRCGSWACRTLAARRRRGRGARALPRAGARRRARGRRGAARAGGARRARLGGGVLRHGGLLRLPPPGTVAPHRRGPPGPGRARGGRGGGRRHLLPRPDPARGGHSRPPSRPSTWPRGCRDRPPPRPRRPGPRAQPAGHPARGPAGGAGAAGAAAAGPRPPDGTAAPDPRDGAAPGRPALSGGPPRRDRLGPQPPRRRAGGSSSAGARRSGCARPRSRARSAPSS